MIKRKAKKRKKKTTTKKHKKYKNIYNVICSKCTIVS